MTKSEALERIEDQMRDLVRGSLEARRTDLEALGLQLELEPVARHGEGGSYASPIEATLRWPDGDVHDVIFFYVVQGGGLVVDVDSAASWITDVIDRSIAEARGSTEQS